MNDYTPTKQTFKDLIIALERANTAEKGEICAKLLLSTKVTVVELASILGVSRQTIFNWVNEFKNSISEGGAVVKK